MSKHAAEQRAGQVTSSAENGASPAGDTLARDLAVVARLLEHQDDSEAALQAVVSSAIALVPGAEEGSISVVMGRRTVESRAASSDLPRRVDALQAETGEGPCLDAVYDQRTVTVPDLRSEQRWPRFSRQALQAGAGSMLSFQLYVEGDNLGALNLYNSKPDAFDEESEHVGSLFAAHAAVAFATVQKQDQYQQAMTTRDLIGQAKGILMERYTIDGDQAFRVLVRYSQNANRKLREVADELVRTRKLTDARG